MNSKVDTLAKSVEENQERTKANEARISEVDQKATAAAAGGSESRAGGQRADAAYTAAEAVNTRADAIEKASKRLVYEVVLSEDKGNFKFGKAVMPDDAKAEIDTLVQKLKPSRTAPSSKSKATPTRRARLKATIASAWIAPRT